MELDIEDAAVEHFEVDPVYENIAAPKYWDFGRSSPEDGAVDKWFEDPNTVVVGEYGIGQLGQPLVLSALTFDRQCFFALQGVENV
jgi:hypothetical protein